MQALFLIVMIPLTLIQVIGGITGGVWLAVLGQWELIAYGAAALVAPFFLQLVLSPGFLVAGPAIQLIRAGRIGAAIPFVFLSQLFVFAAIGVWCIGVFSLFVPGARVDMVWPVLIWSFVVALGPWLYLARDDSQGRPGEGSFMAVFFAQVSYVAMAAAFVLYGLSYTDLVLLFAGTMAAGVVAQTALTTAIMLRAKAEGRS